jgi:hypothetical protein
MHAFITSYECHAENNSLLITGPTKHTQNGPSMPLL